MEPIVKSKMSGRTKAALWLLIAPTALLVATFIIFAIVNWISLAVGGQAANDQLFGPTPIAITIMNVILFIVGAITVVTWLPGLIIGIVLLATKK